MKTTLIERRKFFDTYGARPAEKAAAPPPGGARFSCPCCGYPTLTGRAMYQICELCWWEDDGQDDADADVVMGSPNQDYSLAEARANFERYEVMYPPERDPRLLGPDSETMLALKRDLIATFEGMMTAQSADELDAAWACARDLEQQLYQQLKMS
jgi:hypothetical protein